MRLWYIDAVLVEWCVTVYVMLAVLVSNEPTKLYSFASRWISRFHVFAFCLQLPIALTVSELSRHPLLTQNVRPTLKPWALMLGEANSPRSPCCTNWRFELQTWTIPSGVAIGCARRVVHAVPLLWDGSLEEPCVSEEDPPGALLESLHAGPLQPCYATADLNVKLHLRDWPSVS